MSHTAFHSFCHLIYTPFGSQLEILPGFENTLFVSLKFFDGGICFVCLCVYISKDLGGVGPQIVLHMPFKNKPPYVKSK